MRFWFNKIGRVREWRLGVGTKVRCDCKNEEVVQSASRFRTIIR